jgi:hypothetical protein
MVLTFSGGVGGAAVPILCPLTWCCIRCPATDVNERPRKWPRKVIPLCPLSAARRLPFGVCAVSGGQRLGVTRPARCLPVPACPCGPVAFAHAGPVPCCSCWCPDRCGPLALPVRCGGKGGTAPARARPGPGSGGAVVLTWCGCWWPRPARWCDPVRPGALRQPWPGGLLAAMPSPALVALTPTPQPVT